MRRANKTKSVHMGSQRLYRFANGYGASVVRHAFSYGGSSGKWELAVTKYHGPDIDDFKLTYDTPITNDVIGWLDDDEADALLARIEALPTLQDAIAKAEGN